MGAKTHELLTFDLKGHYAWLVWCPACDEPHTFDGRWEFDGNHEAPSFLGSMLAYESPGSPRCHSLLVAGVWTYLSDCTHAFKDQKLPAPDWSTTRFGRRTGWSRWSPEVPVDGRHGSS
jgi:hypothetical protein